MGTHRFLFIWKIQMFYNYQSRHFAQNTIIGNIIAEFVAPTDDDLINYARTQVGIIGGQPEAVFCNLDDLHHNGDGSWTVEVWHTADRYILQWDGQMQGHNFPGFNVVEFQQEAWADVLDEEEDW